MPHLLIDRIRANLFVTRKNYSLLAYAIEAADVLGGLLFVVGSACFLPPYSHDMQTFLAGCIIYVVGSALYFVVCIFTLVEAYVEKGVRSWEFYENALYLLGSWIFFIGTVFYWPEDAHHHAVHFIQQCSLAQYFNLFSPEFEGTLLFIAGSVLFAMAAFANALNQRCSDDLASRLLTAVTTLYMIGSILFIVGSFAFLPDLGCGVMIVTLGAWTFIIGSMFYLLAAVLSFYRTHHMLSGRSQEAAPLLPASDK
mmetsp:Transcript_65437/g.170312  ORF Transcript_65437/g.170312 Transcript_65437/m.170312 type:complete len:254 (-) Transcript_65437:80-841(-)